MNKKTFFYSIFLLLLTLSLIFTQTKPSFKKSLNRQKPISENEMASYPEKPFVIVIPSYNNALFYERNLRSVFDQDYHNFRVIYIDDCSTDDTYQKVRDLLDKSSIKDRVTLVRNEKNQGAMANFYRTIHSCNNDEIIVILDGDDWFAHESVLKKLNSYYANPNIWMTYGSYLEYPEYHRGACAQKIPKKVLLEHGVRSYDKKGFIFSHVRTFYAGLFKKIKKVDFLYEGNFFEAACDVAMMIPMAELAGEHVCFVKDILYIYNIRNPISDNKIKQEKQISLTSYVRSLPPYQPLKNLSSLNNLADGHEGE